MYWKAVLAVTMLGATMVSGGCARREEGKSGPSSAARPLATPTPTPDLTMVFEGLVDIDYRDLGSGPVLSALMVDATKKDAALQVPSCVDPDLEEHYLPHEAAIFVQDATVTENGTTTNPPVVIPLSNHDVTVSTGAPGFRVVDLVRLVSGDELQQGFGNAAAALNVHPTYYTGTLGDNNADPLVARVRLDGADTVEARTNVCEKGLPLARQKHFRFEAEPHLNTEHCRLGPAPGTAAVQLGEDVLVTRDNVSTVTLTLTKQNSNPRTIVVNGIAGRPFGIAFRNVLHDHLDDRIDACPLTAHEHYPAYRWYYRLEVPPGVEPSMERCKVAPCRACRGTDPAFECPTGGLKCPTP